MKVKHFGLVTATIDDTAKRVEFQVKPISGDQWDLGRGHREWCMTWAIDALRGYVDRGYVFSGTAVPG